jgi:2,5-diketo-D-gluconate reductase A
MDVMRCRDQTATQSAIERNHMPGVPAISLNNGNTIPQLGFGVFQIKPNETAQATSDALEVGYRHIDTAQMYGNEKEVGEAVAKSGLDRADIFITSKVNNNRQTRDDVLASFDESLDKLGIDYIDLMLIHWPLPTVRDYTIAWKALEEVYRDGRARSIGVSNFNPHHIRRLHSETEIPPAINQIEVHPYLTQTEVRDFDTEHQIVTEAWSPIAQGKVLDDPLIESVARRVERTPAQVVLRWHIQRGDVVFPKSVSIERMRENFALFDFELSPEDMETLSSLNKDERTGPDPDVFAYVP